MDFQIGGRGGAKIRFQSKSICFDPLLAQNHSLMPKITVFARNPDKIMFSDRGAFRYFNQAADETVNIFFSSLKLNILFHRNPSFPYCTRKGFLVVTDARERPVSCAGENMSGELMVRIYILEDPALRSKDSLFVDPRMVGILVILALMFVIICAVLQMFSRHVTMSAP